MLLLSKSKALDASAASIDPAATHEAISSHARGHRVVNAGFVLLIALLVVACSTTPPSTPSPSRASQGDDDLAASPSATASPTPTASLPAGCVNPPVDVATLVDATQGDESDPQNEQSDPVACYGNALLTFDATWLGGGVFDCPTAPEPAWLACSGFSLQPAGDTRKVGAPNLFVHIEPSASLSIPSEPYAQVRVTGHFDDPAAQTCRETQPFPGAPVPDSVMIENCRKQFVVTEVEPLE